MTNQHVSKELRRDWLAVLSRAPRALLERHAASIVDAHFEWLREPEFGLAMLRGRIGNTGDRFNLGEATMTRCVLRHRTAAGAATAGLGYVLGRDAQRAEWVARIDALLQQPEHHAALMRGVIEPLRVASQAVRDAEQSRSAASRVRFYTMTPESTA